MKKTNESDLPVRQLIKFSNYSLCITLPKNFIDDLGWQQGDRIAFQLTQDSNLLLEKQSIQPTAVISPTPPISSSTPTLNPTPIQSQPSDLTLQTPPLTPQSSNLTPDTDGLEPIPQLN